MATIDTIKKLHISMIDTRSAYGKAQEEAEEPQLKIFFATMASMKQKDHDELHRVLTEMGEKPNEDGSFMTTVHKTVIAVRAAIKGVDRDSLTAFANGEQNIVKEYDEALRQDNINQVTADLLTRQRSALLTSIADMKAMSKHEE